MILTKKNALVAAAIAGLMASSSVAMAGSAFPGHDCMNKSHCDLNSCKGVGSCKGHHSCKGGKHSCGGKNGCSGHEAAAKVENGQLKTQ